MEPLIRHVRFFNGQFLRQDEFNTEKLYGTHMRRRVSYALFDDGVVQITPTDLTIEFVAAKRIRIRRGMAIGSNHDVMEAREIILRQDSASIDLAATFGAGDTVWVTVNYREDPSVPVPLGAVTENSRIDESAEIQLHAADPTGNITPAQDPLIVLGSVDFDTMAISPAGRQQARLRAAITGGGGGGGPATLTSIAITPPAPIAVTVGAAQALTATGTFSDASTAVLTSAGGLTWSSSNLAIATVSAAGVVTGVSAGAVTITATQGAISQAAAVNVNPPAVLPVIISLSPPAFPGQASNATVDIVGTNLHGPFLAPGSLAIGTQITVRSGAVTIPGVNPQVRAPIGGNQVVRFTMPPRDASWGVQQAVTIDLTFGGSTASAPYRYDD